MKFEYCRDCRDEVVWWAFLVNIAQMTYKGLLGMMTGSAALVADAMHSGADVVASGVTMGSLKLSNRPADEQHPYGYGNIQFISSSIVGLILIFGAIYLIFESVSAIIAGDISEPNPMALLGALISALTNEIMYRYQSCVGTENKSPAIMANAWDNRSDALSSVGVLVGIGIAVMGFPIADNLAAVVVGLMVIHIGIELNQEAISGLMDSSLDIDDLKQIYDLSQEVEGVIGVVYLRGRHVGEEMHVDMNLHVDKNLSVKEGDQIVRWVKEKITYGMEHIHDIRVSLTPAQVVKGRQSGRKGGRGAHGEIPVVTVN